MAQGVLITLEGVEGSGKTTQAARLADTLRTRGLPASVTREPGGTPAGQAIRAILLDSTVALAPATELLLLLADRAQHVRDKLRPALARGEIIISDRYADSTTAYQGFGRGLDRRLLRSLNELAGDSLAPNLTIVLDLPPEVGLERARTRSAATIHADRLEGHADRFESHSDRFEREDLDFHRRVREGFLAVAREAPQRVQVVDASGAVEEVAAAIRAVVATRLGIGT